MRPLLAAADAPCHPAYRPRRFAERVVLEPVARLDERAVPVERFFGEPLALFAPAFLADFLGAAFLVPVISVAPVCPAPYNSRWPLSPAPC